MKTRKQQRIISASLLCCAAVLVVGCAKNKLPDIEQDEPYYVRIEAADGAFYFYDADGTALPMPDHTINETYEEHVNLGAFTGTNSGFSLDVLAPEIAGSQDSVFAIYSFFTKVEELQTDFEYYVSPGTSGTRGINGRMSFWRGGEIYQSFPNSTILKFSEITGTHVKGTFQCVLQAYDDENWLWKDKFLTITRGEFFVPRR